jgi:hypothetical protein
MAQLSRITLADFKRLQEEMLALKHENYALRDRDRKLQDQQLQGQQPSPAPPAEQKPRQQGVPPEGTVPSQSRTGAASSSTPARFYPNELNPFGEARRLSSARPLSPGLLTGSGVVDAEQGSTGDAEGFHSLTPVRAPRTAAHAVRQEAARRAFALRRAATLRLVWHGWRSAHAHSRIFKNLQAAVLATRQPPTPPGVTPAALAAATGHAQATGIHTGLAVSAGCFSDELGACEERIHHMTLRHAQQCSVFWTRTAAWGQALIRQRERSHAALYFHAWRMAHEHARQMARVAGIAAALAELADGAASR